MAKLKHLDETCQEIQIGHIQGNGTQCYIEVTYEIRVFLKGAKKEVFSSIFKKSL
jgi:hypothetical protein